MYLDFCKIAATKVGLNVCTLSYGPPKSWMSTAHVPGVLQDRSHKGGYGCVHSFLWSTKELDEAQHMYLEFCKIAATKVGMDVCSFLCSIKQLGKA